MADREIIKQQFELSTGPLPPPGVLEKYNQVVPGAAERILKMAESQSQHRQTLERKVIDHDIVNSRLGIICAFIIAVTFIIVSYMAAVRGHSAYGAIMGTGGITGMVSVFIYGSRARAKERAIRKN